MAGLVLITILVATSTLTSAELVLLGTHPTSPLTAFPTIHTMKAHAGRIYLGYGDWNVFPAVTVTSFDPIDHAFHIEYSIYSDSIGIFREIGGVLYVPSIDGVLHTDFRDYTYRQNGVWRDRTPAGMYHVLDVGTVDGTDLWLVGAKGPNETLTYNHGVFRSSDGGRSWQDMTLQSTRDDGRYYWGFGLRNKFYVIDTVYDGPNATRTSVGTYRHVNKATTMGSGSNEFIVGVTGWVKGIGAPTATSLVSYDTQAWRTLRSSVFDFTVNGTNIFTLEASAPNAIWMGSAVTASGASWARLPLSPVPSNAKCIEVLDGVVYIGDTQGRLWAGRADGGTMATNQAAIINELSDDFGRSLSFDGDLLAVGAPDHSSNVPLSGQVTIWQTSGVRSEANWKQVATLDPPASSFSGWFGKKVALNDDVLAVVEAGRDTSKTNRCGSAQVHLYERVGQDWLRRSAIAHPFAQSVALDSGWLAVGATNSLTLYKIVRAPSFGLTFRTNFHPSSLFANFRALACVGLEGDLCAFGVQGDVSIGGAPGEVHIYQRNEADTWQPREVLRSPVPLPAEPGWAYAYDPVAGVWHADGHPADFGVPQTTRLNSPAITITNSGDVQLSFRHRWSFEYTNQKPFDGGQVRVSINRTPYIPVPQAAFTQVPYNGMVLANSWSVLHGQAAFIAESTGHAAGTRVTSTCTLGVLNAGDTVSVQFLYGADTNARGDVPNWEIDSVTLSVAGVPFHVDDFDANDGGYAVETDPYLPPDRFAFALAMDNAWLAVGAPRDDTVALQAGAVHLYERTNAPDGAASFVLRQSILSPLNQPEAGFGTSVALNGASLMVGCPGAELNGQSQRGAVFVFRLETNRWHQVAEVFHPSGSTGEFGSTVAFGSNWLAAASRFSSVSSNVADRVTVWPFGPPGGKLAGVHRPAADAFELSASGEIGRKYVLEAATELPASNWSNVSTFRLTTPATNLVDSPATAPHRFYRLRAP